MKTIVTWVLQVSTHFEGGFQNLVRYTDHVYWFIHAFFQELLNTYYLLETPLHWLGYRKKFYHVFILKEVQSSGGKQTQYTR